MKQQSAPQLSMLACAGSLSFSLRDVMQQEKQINYTTLISEIEQRIETRSAAILEKKKQLADAELELQTLQVQQKQIDSVTIHRERRSLQHALAAKEKKLMLLQEMARDKAKAEQKAEQLSQQNQEHAVHRAGKEARTAQNIVSNLAEQVQFKKETLTNLYNKCLDRICERQQTLTTLLGQCEKINMLSKQLKETEIANKSLQAKNMETRRYANHLSQELTMIQLMTQSRECARNAAGGDAQLRELAYIVQSGERQLRELQSQLHEQEEHQKLNFCVIQSSGLKGLQFLLQEDAEELKDFQDRIQRIQTAEAEIQEIVKKTAAQQQLLRTLVKFQQLEEQLINKKKGV